MAMDSVSNSSERRSRGVDDDLHLDRVVASHPEIGPTPPDGGYGWMILVSAIIYHVTIPGLLTMYGFIILKSVKNEGREDLRVWDVDIALVPVVMVVMRLLLESWCRVVVNVFNMPRFMALAGLCLTVAGVLLSSYSTDADTNDHIINIFAGFFAGSGCALTGQQTEVIITHYFKQKLSLAQRLLQVAPSFGNCIIPLLIGYLCSNYSNDIVVMIYSAILMQNCLFLAAYTRPIYIEKVIRNTFMIIKDAVEDEDEVIFTNQSNSNSNVNNNKENNSDINDGPSNINVEDGEDHVVVFNSKINAREIFDPSINFRQKETNASSNTNRFSSDFNTIYNNEDTSENRFSSDFGRLDITGSYHSNNGYRELESIDQITQNPQPLYGETTHTTEQNNSYMVDPNMTVGTTRRTISLKKNFITILNMLKDIDFYLYSMLHLSTTFSLLVYAVVFPTLLWERNSSMNIWKVTATIVVSYIGAFSFVMLFSVFPKSTYIKYKMCALFCTTAAIGFYGITLSSSKTFLVIWGLLASFSTAASGIVQQPLYNNVLNEFDTTATIATSNFIVAAFIMIWCISFNYAYKTCFFTASILYAFTSLIFLASLFKRHR